MSLWAEYKQEREGSHTLEKEWGFVNYLIAEGECYIQDMYVIKDMRRKGKTKLLTDELVKLARASNCTTLTAAVIIGSPGDTESMQTQLAYGLRLLSVQGNRVIMGKKI